jgi:hypothetical protein
VARSGRKQIGVAARLGLRHDGGVSRSGTTCVAIVIALFAALACDGSLESTSRLGPDASAGDAGGSADAASTATDGATSSDARPGPIDAGTSPDAGPPDTGPPEPLPLPDESATVNALASERPDLLAASCLETGGNNDFLFELVRRLRAIDDRWGLNWKRGVVGDMSQDVVDYHFGHGEREGSTDVYIIDVIAGHCGDSPGPTWIDQTEATRKGGTIGMWTLAGRTDL